MSNQFEINDIVRITAGIREGVVGQIIEIKERGWLVVAEGSEFYSVRSTQIELVDLEKETAEVETQSFTLEEALEAERALEEGDEGVSPRGLSKRIKLYREGYMDTVAASGAPSKNNGDRTAQLLEGKSLEQVYEIAASIAHDIDWGERQLRYAKLNAGHQRMIIGNIIRARLPEED